MSPSCARCGRDLPDFVRVCQHCGEPVAAQRQLPVFAESLLFDDDELQAGFDFTPAPEPVTDPVLEPLETVAASFDDDAYEEMMPAASESVLEDEAVPYVELYDEPGPEVEFAEKSEPAHTPGILFGVQEETPPRRSRWRELAFATFVIGAGGAFTFAAMRGNGDTQPNALREPQGVLSSPKDANSLTTKAPSAERPVSPAPAAEPAPAPTPAPAPADAPAPAGGRWNAGNLAWTGTSPRAVAFEIEANNMVSIWMRSVRPTLVVRCTAGKVEAFIYTSSAARIEPGTDDHTVRYSFDSGHETEQRWRDSEEHDALFAPDGESIARRLMDANMFRFVFTPHNAAPASTHFSVAGLRPLIESQRNCQVK